MNDPDALNIWSEDQLVAYLWRDQASPPGTGLRYAREWVENGGFAISQTLPLKTDEFPAAAGGVVQKFFANLLPEGGARERVVRDLKIPDTDFDLLRAIGGDCAGALSILPTERTPNFEQQYSPLSDEQLLKLIKRRGRNYEGISANNRPRLSLAGAQDKCPILIRGDRYLLPLQEAASSHILKFEIPDYKNVPAYETFNTMLAHSIGLPTVEIQLSKLDARTYMCIKRYDRREDTHGKIHRLHQEDFCQALGYGHQYKYEAGGGPTFSKCFQLVQDASSDPVIDTQNLLKWQIFNVLAGNSDGHAKNISLLYTAENQTRLSPFYDLVCTRAIARIDDHIAFSVGGERNPNRINHQNWAEEAKKCDVRPGFIQGMLEDTAQKLLGILSETKRQFEKLYGDHPALQRVEQIIERQCTRNLGRRN